MTYGIPTGEPYIQLFASPSYWRINLVGFLLRFSAWTNTIPEQMRCLENVLKCYGFQLGLTPQIKLKPSFYRELRRSANNFKFQVRVLCYKKYRTARLTLSCKHPLDFFLNGVNGTVLSHITVLWKFNFPMFPSKVSKWITLCWCQLFCDYYSVTIMTSHLKLLPFEIPNAS